MAGDQRGFVTARNRDAWGPIRGFVFQVEKTMARWLSLAPDQVLELERGEDIDTVAQALSLNDSAKEIRLLEQVKHREARISLKSPEATEFLTNARLHLLSNPTLDLSFRYVTTATPARERPNPFTPRNAGISVWNDLRLATAPGSLELNGIRAILRQAEPPSRELRQQWEAFQHDFCGASDAYALMLLRRIEWSVGEPDANQTRSEIQSALAQRCQSADLAAATDTHARLFVFVLQLLCQPGLKRLAADELTRLLQQPWSTSDASPLHVAVRTLLEDVHERMVGIEDRIGRTERQLLAFGQQLGDLTRTTGATAGLVPSSKRVLLPPPALDQRACRRTALVRRIVAHLSAGDAFALWGSMGSGKTVTARLTAEQVGKSSWVSFYGLTAEAAAKRLDDALERIADIEAGTSFEQLTTAAVLALTPKHLVVLEDLPDLLENDELGRRLAHLFSTAKAAKRPVLVTASRELPVSVLALTQQLEVPPMSPEEIVQTLLSRGVDEALATSPTLLDAMETACRGNPTLVMTAAELILTSPEDDISVRLQREIGHGPLATRISRTVSARLKASAQRDLLFRLCLVIDDFGRSEAQVVAEVEPPIAHPAQVLSELHGPWISGDTASSTLTVSPLVRQLGPENLTEETRRRVRLALAALLLRCRRLGTDQFLSAVLYLIQAGDHARAVSTLITALASAYSQQPHSSFELLVDVSLDDAFLWKSSTQERILLRGLEVALSDKLGRRTEEGQQRLVRLFTEVGGAAPHTVCIIAAMLGVGARSVTPPFRNQMLSAFLDARQRASLEGESNSLPNIDDWLWFNAVSCRSSSDVENWIQTLVGLPAQYLRAALRYKRYPQAALLLVDRLWMRESEKAEADRNWPRVIALLERTHLAATAAQLTLLAALALRAKIIVLAEYCRDLPAARQAGSLAVTQFAKDPCATFMLNECLARQLLYAGHAKDGCELLRGALGEECETFPLERMWGFTELAKRQMNRQIARAHLSTAYEIGASNPDVPELELARVQGELAIVEWYADRREHAFDSLAGAVDRVVRLPVAERPVKELIVRLAHVAGFMAHSARFGQPPERGSDGESYGAPFLGMLAPIVGQASSLFRPDQLPALAGQVALFAEGLNDFKGAGHWASRALDIAERTGGTSAVYIFLKDALHALLVTDKITECLDGALQFTVSMVASKRTRAKGEDFLSSAQDPFVLLGAPTSSNAAWREAELACVDMIAPPLCCHLLTLRLRGRDVEVLVQEAASFIGQMVPLSVLPDLWRDLRTLLLSHFSATCPPALNISEIRTSEEPLAFKFIRLMVGSMRPDATLMDSAGLQLMALPRYSEDWEPCRGLVIGIVWKFVFEFWQDRLEKQRFGFFSPRLVDLAFAEAGALPEGKRLRHLLRQVVASVGISNRLGSVITDWLTAA